MRRFVAFLLGVIFGIILVFGAVGAGIYYAVGVATPKTVLGEEKGEQLLGSFSDLSILKMAERVKELYTTKLEVDENGNYYTLGTFCQENGIDIKALAQIDLPQEVLDIPMFEFFRGDEGVNKALNQIKISAVPKLVNLFAPQDENGNPIISETLTAKLADNTLADLLNEEVGVLGVLSDVQLCELLASAFPAENSDNKLMWALGQGYVGKLLGAFSGEDNLFLQLKEGGALECLGALAFSDLLGEDSQLLNTILGNKTISSLVDENGSINPDSLVGNLYLGSLLGFETLEISIEDLNDTNKYALSDLSTENVKLYESLTDDTQFALQLEDKFFQAEVTCLKTPHVHDGSCAVDCAIEQHSHDLTCIGFVWYESENQEISPMANGEKKRASGLFGALAGVKVGDLLEGKTDSILQKVMEVKLSELTTLPESGLVAIFKDYSVQQLLNGGIDNLYLGDLFDYKRNQLDESEMAQYTTSVSDNVKSKLVSGETVYAKQFKDAWYQCKLTCAEEHAEHNLDDCFGFVWYKRNHTAEGIELDDSGNKYVVANDIQGKLSNVTVGNISKINKELNSMTLRDVLGENVPSQLRSLQDENIGNLATALNKIFVGDMLGYVRAQTNDLTGYADVVVASGTAVVKYDAINDKYAKLESNVWYQAKLDCANSDALHLTHDQSDCYNYVWYKEDTEHGLVTIDGKPYSVVERGVIEKLIQLTVGQLNGDAISSIVNDTTLGEVLGDTVASNAILAEMQNVKICDLGANINNIFIGTAIGNLRKQIADVSDYESVVNGTNDNVLKDNDTDAFARFDGENWYEVTLTCNDSHQHEESCYGYVWYKDNDGAIGEQVTGITAKLSGKQISQLGGDAIDDLINDTTLGEVLGDTVASNAILAEMQDVKISQLSAKITSVFIGTAIGNVRKEIADVSGYETSVVTIGGVDTVLKDGETGAFAKLNDEKWYEANVTCDNASHTHNENCYGFVWYNDDSFATQTTGISTILSNKRLDELSGNGIGQLIKNTKLCDVIEINSSNKILFEMKDVSIANLSSEINDLYLGTAMGYVRKDVSNESLFDVNGMTAKTIIDSVTYTVVQNANGKWYLASNLNCALTHAHNAFCYDYYWFSTESTLGLSQEIDGVTHYQVLGLNGKISNTTISELGKGTGLTEIITNLTLKDLINSGMMDLGGEENEYKFAVLLDHDGGCTLSDYFTYLLTHPSATFKSYYESKTHSHAYDEWKDLTLGDFIDQLLDSLSF